MTDDQGNQFEDKIDIEVLSSEKIVSSIQRSWDSMVAALDEGDIEKTLAFHSGGVMVGGFVDPRVRQKLSEVTRADIDAMHAYMHDLNLSSVTWPVASCYFAVDAPAGKLAWDVSAVFDGADWKILEF